MPAWSGCGSASSAALAGQPVPGHRGTWSPTSASASGRSTCRGRHRRAAASSLIGLLYVPFITTSTNFNAPTTKLTGASHGGGFVVIAVLTVLGAPFFEELFFRGLLFGACSGSLRAGPGRPTARRHRRRGGGGASLDGLLFGLAHGELDAAGRPGRLRVHPGPRLPTEPGGSGMNMVAHATFNLVAVIAIASSQRRG